MFVMYISHICVAQNIPQYGNVGERGGSLNVLTFLCLYFLIVKWSVTTEYSTPSSLDFIMGYSVGLQVLVNVW